jgi:hypothetical protein
MCAAAAWRLPRHLSATGGCGEACTACAPQHLGDHDVVDVACTPGDGDAVSTGYSRHSDCCRLLSDAFHDYAVHYSTDASADGSPLMTTASYLATEEAEAVKCQEMFEVVRKYETLHTNTWQVGAELSSPGVCTCPAVMGVTYSQSYRQVRPQIPSTFKTLMECRPLVSRSYQQRHNPTLRATSSWCRRCCKPAAASASATR